MTQPTFRTLPALLAAGLLCCGAAPRSAIAADEASEMAAYFGNTVEIAVPAGDWQAKRYFAPDHTYRDVGTDGEVRGTWRFEGDRICTQQTDPIVLAPPYCNMGLGHKVGDRWTAADPVTTNLVLFHLAAGLQEKKP